ncbi:MAG: hypothetical protein ISN26_06975 [Betaproteobacteria bacterium AqS2]|uniref:Uncharacterized protein n=1 Tax=Candidatus Amphirhobacter heronislandensis TaxID=1732024 RepID=A0A930UDB0_9GAMM|nr:hypothetical protein [Betaproteobacteria bacterium AqS2]
MSILANAPQLRPGKADYVNASFTSEVIPEERALLVRHMLTSGNLVFQLLKEQKAVYACEIISPRSSLRQLHIADKKEGSNQRIAIEPDRIVREKTLVRPLVLSTAHQSFTGEEKHGLGKFMQGLEFEFDEGSIIAEGEYIELAAKHNNLFIVVKDPELDDGTYKIAHAESPDFVFSVRLALDLFKKYDNTDEKIQDIFMSGVFASALTYLVMLNEEAKEEDGDIVEQHEALESMFEILDRFVPDAWGRLKKEKDIPLEIASKWKNITFDFKND